jgi:hypothetical protein
MPLGVTEITDLAIAESLWRNNIPCETIFDLWEVRMAFHRQFRRPFRLLYAAEASRKLFVALSWVEEKGAWCFFPGETWHGKTWLEQNHPLMGGMDAESFRCYLGADLYLRYLLLPTDSVPSCPVDEIGYLFHPPLYQYRIENWWSSFSHKRAKLLKRELATLEKRGIDIRHDKVGRFDQMVSMNMEQFGTDSFFAEPRFREGFRGMIESLDQMGLIRVTSLYYGGKLAAIDMGSVFNGRYTLLAGGTDPQFPGVAKLINLHHLQWACEQQLDEVDFLCGDFLWKPLFHLTPRPLYLFSSL